MKGHVLLTSNIDHVKLSEALQNDMLQAALRLRNLLYSISRTTKDSHYAEWDVERALLDLDFPHFIPMQNSIDALQAEHQRLSDLTDDIWENIERDFYNLETAAKFDRHLMQLEDVTHELGKRLGCHESIGGEQPKVTFVGVIDRVRPLITKNNDTMAVVTILENGFEQEIVVFPRTYAAFRHTLQARFVMDREFICNFDGEMYVLEDILIGGLSDSKDGSLCQK